MVLIALVSYLPAKKVTGFEAKITSRRKQNGIEEETMMKQGKTKTDQEDTNKILTKETGTEQEETVRLHQEEVAIKQTKVFLSGTNILILFTKCTVG